MHVVQGIGPKLAMSILSTLEPPSWRGRCATATTRGCKRIPGIGKKTAERLVLELRDKFDAPAAAREHDADGQARRRAPHARQVSSALINLGYKPAEAERAAEDAAKAHAGAASPSCVKAALRILAE